ncbi:unnamed protein product, partial [Brassica rapa]
LCVLNRQPTWAKVTQTVHGKGQRTESKDQRADMCTDGQPRTSSTDVLCVLTDTHGHTRTATDVMCVLTDTHVRPVCADGHPRTSCIIHERLCVAADTHGQPRDISTERPYVCGQTPTDVCVLNKQPTWAKITRTVHGKASRAESGQRADMCTDGQPRTSCVCLVRHTNTHGQPRTSCGRSVMCVLTDTHGRRVCADGHTQTHTDSHRRLPRTSCGCWRTPMDVLCVLNRQPTWAKITQTVHGKGHRAYVLSLGPTCDMCTDGQPRRPRVWRRTHTDSQRHPVCADGHKRTQPTWAKITRTVHGKGQRTEASVRSPRTRVLICVLMDSHGHLVCVERHTQKHTDTHGQPHTHGRPMCADGQPRTATDVLCMLADTHRRPVCTEQTAHVGQNHPNNGHTRTHTDVLCMLMDTHGRPVCADGHPQAQPTWAKITRTVHGKGQRAESKDQRADMCTDGQPRTSSTDVLCVLTDSHRQPRTSFHGTGQRAESKDQLHREGQRAESKDQRADMCTDGQPQTSCVC